MKKIITFISCIILILCVGCAKSNYILTEDTFFLVMTNIQYYPSQYLDCEIEYDCFTYSLKDVDGKEYTCGVRKCSSGYGCTCGKDTIIGFLLDCDFDLPKPINQSEDTVEKSWVHLRGKLKDDKKKSITVNSYTADGEVDVGNTEKIIFLEFEVYNFYVIENYQNLKYYVTK